MGAGRDAKYHLSGNEFIIENYNQSKPFSSFLPAIAGLHGKPMWVYYVNRGQCVATFGINNKDQSILEFQPANKAYRHTPLQGFRTFLKIRDAQSERIICYEPFRDLNMNVQYDINQKMCITSHDLKLVEVNKTLGIKIEVMFCTLPGESISSLIRTVSITNISGKLLELEVIDGLPIIIPYYLINNDMKNESNLRQAWMGVDNYDKIPFYKIKVLPYDTAETVFVEGGNFYINFCFDKDMNLNILKTVVDPGLIFGNVTDLSYPEGFYNNNFEVPEKQVNVGITPCGFSYKKTVLPAGDTDTCYTLAGNSDRYEKLIDFAEDKLSHEYITEKIHENMNLVESLKNRIFTFSSSNEFNLYSGQTFVDNFLRGGYPIQIGNGRHTFYVYSRKHGDLEREYNFFQIDSTYYSQGNANFRDVNQNRRNDVCFFPFIEDANIKTFFNLLQLDGFNPLVLKGSVFKIESAESASRIINEYILEKSYDTVMRHVSAPYTPGSLLELMEFQEIEVKKGTLDEFVNNILSISVKSDEADFKEGYWVDHWTYNSDLLEQFYAIFPDKMIKALFDDYSYTYFDNCEVVVPRDRKYLLTDKGVRQLGSLAKVEEKERMIRERKTDRDRVYTGYGKGTVYKCSLISKIVCLLVNKIASLDAQGVGVEMEADKPGWCDALNGLPAILGSSINESAEIKRLALILLDILNTHGVEENKKIQVPEELHDFFEKVCSALFSGMDNFEYWDFCSKAREDYRKAVLFGVSGIEREIDIKKLKSFLMQCISRIDEGLEKAFNSEDGLHYTYFINEVVDYKLIKDANGKPMKDSRGYQYVKPVKFRQKPLPYFLEGPVHILRTEKEKDRARNIYRCIQKTGLYDEKLKMYRVNDNIMNATKEIGRQNIFPRGWLENESVFLHMEYKYLLELLRCGLYEEFFKDMKNALIPFLDPSIYGRSILENSSFIASSVHPDSKVHGTGFVSRLTGASAEFLNIWLYMCIGMKPFTLDDSGELCLKFEPVLPGWMFIQEPQTVGYYSDMKFQNISLPGNSFACSFLGNTILVYINEKRKDTYGNNAAVVERIVLHQNNGMVKEIEGDRIPSPLSYKVRDGYVKQIDIFLE